MLYSEWLLMNMPSYAEAEKLTGINRNHLSEYVNWLRFPKQDTAEKIAKALGKEFPAEIYKASKIKWKKELLLRRLK